MKIPKTPWSENFTMRSLDYVRSWIGMEEVSTWVVRISKQAPMVKSLSKRLSTLTTQRRWCRWRRSLRRRRKPSKRSLKPRSWRSCSRLRWTKKIGVSSWVSSLSGKKPSKKRSLRNRSFWRKSRGWRKSFSMDQRQWSKLWNKSKNCLKPKVCSTRKKESSLESLKSWSKSKSRSRPCSNISIHNKRNWRSKPKKFTKFRPKWTKLRVS